MRIVILLAFGCLLSLSPFAQNTNYFIKSLDAERGATLCPYPDGNMWMAVRDNGAAKLIKIKPDGTLLDRVSFTAGNIVSLIVDSDGMLVGAGNTEDIFGIGFVFRYNPATRALLWFNELESLSTGIFCTIMERGPGGDFVVASTGVFGSSDVLSIARNTGELMYERSNTYSYGFYNGINSALLYKGYLYTTGMEEVNGEGRIRTSLSKIDTATGIDVWTYLSPREFIQYQPDFMGQDVIVDADSLVTVSLTGPTSTGGPLTHTIMQKNTLDGGLAWAKRYVLYSPHERNSVVVEEVANIPDGYVLFGRTYDTLDVNQAFFLIKTDKNGNPKWARLIGDSWSVDIPSQPYKNQVVVGADAIYIISEAKNAAGQQKAILIKTNLNGQIEGCNLVRTIGVQAIDLIGPISVSISRNIQHAAVFETPRAPNPQFGAVPLFVTECEKKATCVDQPDAVLNLDSVSCSAGGRIAHYTLCNAGSKVLEGSFVVSFYPQNPLTDTILLTASWILEADSLAPGSCAHGSVPIDPLGIGHLSQPYVLLGSSEGPTPILPTQFPLGNNPSECDYSNNLSQWKLDVKGPAPDLGSDRSICPGESVLLTAGSSSGGYLWQDGSTAATLSASTTGLYWVEIADACGAKQRDTVRVNVLPNPTRTQKVNLVQGTSVVIGGVTYTQADTVTLTVPSTTGGCDSLITYQIAVLPVQVSISCPPAVVTSIPLGQTTATVNYPFPTASSNCPNAGITFLRLSGPASGSSLPEGTSQVCYAATDACLATKSCCFSITVQGAPPPCDVKTIGCIRYELFSFLRNNQGLTYRLRVVNNCAQAAQTILFQLPAGATAITPANGSVYAAPSGRSYDVRNPNATPFYSIRFRSNTGGLPAGQSEYFEYRLPQQVVLPFLLAHTRLGSGETYEAFLATANCPVQMALDGDLTERDMEAAPLGEMSLMPNPTTGALWMQLPADWHSSTVRVTVLSAQGQQVQELELPTAEGSALPLRLDASLSAGLYHIVAQNAEGQRAMARCILQAK
ncbi:MAG TPA: HYR domain-containing protein [Saprospiraceae bacterium]|nr:HYR domain-containing protein [Saprospiraceae bacterium]